MQTISTSLTQSVEHLNRISTFLAQRDIYDLSEKSLQMHGGRPGVDLLILLGCV